MLCFECVSNDVIFASHKRIAVWYGRVMRLKISHVIIPSNLPNNTLAHPADKILKEARENWKVNGGNIEYQKNLDDLCKLIKGE